MYYTLSCLSIPFVLQLPRMVLKQIRAKFAAYKKARKKRKKQYKEPHRWRHVLVWAVPFASVPAGFTVFASNIRGVWLSVFLWILFVWYCVLLLEWYIWRDQQRQQRQRLRMLSVLLSLLIC